MGGINFKSTKETFDPLTYELSTIDIPTDLQEKISKYLELKDSKINCIVVHKNETISLTFEVWRYNYRYAEMGLPVDKFIDGLRTTIHGIPSFYCCK